VVVVVDEDVRRGPRPGGAWRTCLASVVGVGEEVGGAACAVLDDAFSSRMSTSAGAGVGVNAPSAPASGSAYSSSSVVGVGN
jgi:hypothetical protein